MNDLIHTMKYVAPVIALVIIGSLLYRSQEARMDAAETSLKETQQKLKGMRDVHKPTTPTVGSVPPFSPSPMRVMTTTWAEDHPSWTVLPDELQWWEKKEPYQLAKTLVAKNALYPLRIFLGERLAYLRKNCVPGSGRCLDKWLDMREAVDSHLKEFVSGPTGKTMTWVAVTMMSSDNLKTFHTLVGQQAAELRGCNKEPKCTRSVVRVLDTYFKKVVNDYGGPLIDRKWNSY